VKAFLQWVKRIAGAVALVLGAIFLWKNKGWILQFVKGDLPNSDTWWAIDTRTIRVVPKDGQPIDIPLPDDVEPHQIEAVKVTTQLGAVQIKVAGGTNRRTP
jgi:hypothetical protein